MRATYKRPDSCGRPGKEAQGYFVDSVVGRWTFGSQPRSLALAVRRAESEPWLPAIGGRAYLPGGSHVVPCSRGTGKHLDPSV